jgi:hypothetical protein
MLEIDNKVKQIIDYAGTIRTEYTRLNDKRIKQAGKNVNISITNIKKLLKEIKDDATKIKKEIPKQQRINTKKMDAEQDDKK